MMSAERNSIIMEKFRVITHRAWCLTCVLLLSRWSVVSVYKMSQVDVMVSHLVTNTPLTPARKYMIAWPLYRIIGLIHVNLLNKGNIHIKSSGLPLPSRHYKNVHRQNGRHWVTSVTLIWSVAWPGPRPSGRQGWGGATPGTRGVRQASSLTGWEEAIFSEKYQLPSEILRKPQSGW